jgi:signal transduction histidine kinase
LKSLEDGSGGDDGGAAVADLRQLVVATLQDVRRLAVELRPAALDDFGLVPAIERLRDIVEEQGEVSVEVQSELSDDRLPADAETALYRIAQEAFTNVLKHAGAARVTVRISRRGDIVTLAVHDDGKGFDPTNVREGGLGLLGMQERVALLGGRLTIDSSEGAGTMLNVEVPVR